MNILHSTYTFNKRGGRESMLIDIVNKQCQEHTIHLMIVDDQIDNTLIEEIDKRVNIIYIRKKGSGKITFLKAFQKINKTIRDIKPNVIHCHDITLIRFFIFHRKKAYASLHLISDLTFDIRLFKKIFSISHFMKKCTKEKLNIDSNVIWNGIAIDDYKYKTNYNFDYNTDEFKIVQISRFTKNKGQEVAIKALSSLLQTHPDINVKLYFIGDGENMDKMKELAKTYNVYDNIVVMGAKSKQWIKDNLKDFMLLIQPSLMETFGLSVLEGLTCGLPVVMSNVGGLPEIKNNLDAGEVFEVENHNELANKIYEIYDCYKHQNINNSNYIVRNREKLYIFDKTNTADKYIENY
ncbi:glycosyltransferase involved in cell wall biosynthesis [Dysgonomonadaceae bacterium PH5-43]|nr:glycosyltransferase involved in cell wall biosynthesis [Dysgonomonadaceae bacterium PH5-43]